MFIALAASAGIAWGLDRFLVGGHDTLVYDWHGREVNILAPRWFFLAALTPYVWLVRGDSLTDMSLAQQFLSVGLRGLLIVGCAVALARPTIVSEDKKVATVVLVDVSGISDADQLWLAVPEIVLGVVFLLAAAVLWIRRDRGRYRAAPWVDAVDNLTASRSGGLGLVLRHGLELLVAGDRPRALEAGDGQELLLQHLLAVQDRRLLGERGLDHRQAALEVRAAQQGAAAVQVQRDPRFHIDRAGQKAPGRQVDRPATGRGALVNRRLDRLRAERLPIGLGAEIANIIQDLRPRERRCRANRGHPQNEQPPHPFHFVPLFQTQTSWMRS
jgi:hypothetical protein